MKALLIYPKRDPRSKLRTQFDWQKVFELSFWPFPVRGYGLYLNVLDTLASVNPPGVDVSVVNENIDAIPFEADVDLVGISCMVTNATRAYEIADAFRKRGIPVVMGGYHPFSMNLFGMKDEVLEHADSICISEADDTWAEILRDAAQGTLRKTYEQSRRTDMTTVRHRCVSGPGHWMRYGYLTIQASRGCPFHCNFCSIIEMLGNDMRYKSPEAIVAELEPIYQRDFLGRHLGRHIFLVDDNIYGSPAEFRRILRAIIALNRKYPRFKAFYGSQLTINITKDREALELMREAGFNCVFVGLESLDPVVLRSYEKFHNVAFDYDVAVATLRGYGIEMVSSFIFGQDIEGPGVFEEAFRFFERNHTIYPYFNILVPGARQWQQLHDAGRILSQEWRLYDAQHTVFIPMKMRPLELQRRFVDLVQRVFDYDNIRKRLVGAFVEGGSRQFELSPALQIFFFLKTLAALASRGDREGLRFVLGLRPYILSNRLSMFNILFQIDQHDYAVKNVHSLSEHPYDLDVPSWEERLLARGVPAAGTAPLPQAGAASA